MGVREIKGGVVSRSAGRGKILREALIVIGALAESAMTAEELAARTGMHWRRAYRILDAIRDAGLTLSERARAGRYAGAGGAREFWLPAREMERFFRSRSSAEIDPRRVHEAMTDAPHDGQPYRQARAAIAAIIRGIAEGKDA